MSEKLSASPDGPALSDTFQPCPRLHQRRPRRHRRWHQRRPGGILFGGRGGTGGPGGIGGVINGGAGGTLFGGVGGGWGAAGSSDNSSISPDGGLIRPDAGSPDGGPIQPDAGSPDGRKPAPPPDATSTTQPRRQGCSCNLGQ